VGERFAVTAQFFKTRANKWVDEEIRVKSWQERLFELIKRGNGYTACPGGTGTLVELAVVWEMINKGAMSKKPLVVLGDFWRPVVERVREIELGHASPWCEAKEAMIRFADSPVKTAALLAAELLGH
jgi:predicted Rossmann-fold nucleotide-binding protein